MAAVVASAVVDPAACNDRNLCAVFDIKIIVDHIGDTALA